jgi:hypothetical protein
LQSGIFPDDWKLARVTPINKDGSKTECGNYRPISVISIVAKIFEKLVCSQLRSFMKENNIIIDDQYGFRQYHSTETTLLDSTNEWLGNMDKGLINGVLFLDLKKAFDTFNHKILLSKLELYGIRGRSLDWFRSYFTNRKQVCANNGKPSDEKEIHRGVPQGSSLAPFLFLLYINDLPNCLETTKARLFADDTTLSATGSTVDEIETKPNHDLVNVDQCLIANKLTLYEGKTEFIIIGSRQRVQSFEHGPLIKLGHKVIKRVPHKKTLGVILDEQLKWDKPEPKVKQFQRTLLFRSQTFSRENV